MDDYKNYAYSLLATGITIGATSCTVATGTGSRFPATAFDAVIWDAAYPSATAAVLAAAGEQVRVTARSTDVLTITRAQGGTSAVALNVSGKTYAVAQVLTEAAFEALDPSLLAPKASPTFTGTTTVESLVITKGVTIAPAPMAALVIDIDEQKNTVSLATSSTLTLSAALTSGDTFGCTVTESGGGEITVTIPECYSENRGGLITSFTLSANKVAELGFYYDGTLLRVYNDPLTAAQQIAALGLHAVATSGSAADLSTGVLAPARIAAGGTALQIVRLNAGATALEFAAETGGGGGSIFNVISGGAPDTDYTGVDTISGGAPDTTY